MKILLRIFGVFSLVLITLIIGVNLYLEYVLTDEKIKEKIIHLVSNSIPGGQLSLGNLVVTRGTSLNIKMNEIFLSTRGIPTRENSLFYSKEIFITLPFISIWDISPEINIEGDQIEIRDFPSTGEEKDPSPPEEKKPDKIPSTFGEKLVDRVEKFGDRLLANSTFNFHSRDLTYFDITQSGKIDEVKCSQVNLLFKNITIPLNFHIKCQAGFGDFKSPDIDAKGELLFKDNLEIFADVFLKRVEGPSFLGKIPDVGARLKGRVVDGEFNSSIDASMGYWGHALLDLNTKSGEVTLDSIKWKMDFSTLAYYIKEMPIKKKGEIDISGKLQFTKKGLVPHLFLKLNNAFLELAGEKIPLSLRGEIRKGDYKLNVDASIFNGSIKSDISGKADWGNIPEGFGTIKANMKISSLVIKLPPPKKEEEDTPGEISIPAIPLDLKLDLKKVMFEKIKVEGSGSIKTQKGALNANLKLFLDEAPLTIKIKQKDKKQRAIFDIDLKNFNMALLEGITSPKLGVIRGRANASIDGAILLPVETSRDYSFLAKFSTKNGTYDNFYVADNWDEFIKENPGLERYISKESKSHVDYREIFFSGKIQYKKIQIDKFALNALEDKLIISAKGNLSLGSEKSLIYLSLKDKMGITPSGIKNLLGMGNLHFKLQGRGTNLKPDLLYTSSRMVGESAKSATDTLLMPIDLLLTPVKKKEE